MWGYVNPGGTAFPTYKPPTPPTPKAAPTLRPTQAPKCGACPNPNAPYRIKCGSDGEGVCVGNCTAGKFRAKLNGKWSCYDCK